MEHVELLEQLRATEELIDTYSPDHRFMSGNIRRIHRIWLAPDYRPMEKIFAAAIRRTFRKRA
jgi:hypothetical protein